MCYGFAGVIIILNVSLKGILVVKKFGKRGEILMKNIDCKALVIGKNKNFVYFFPEGKQQALYIFFVRIRSRFDVIL